MVGCLAKPFPGVTWPQPLIATLTAPDDFSEAELLDTLAADNAATETAATATATIRLPMRRMVKPLFSPGMWPFQARHRRIRLRGKPFKATPCQDAFKADVDYAQLVEVYGDPPKDERRRYSPAKCIEAIPNPIYGSPDPEKINTSFVERQNLTMRMSIRRFTRLTNAFSKKVENLAAAVSLHFAYYNYCRPHQSLGGKTPALAAGLEDHIWKVEELITLLSAAEATPIKRGTYRKTRERKAIERGEAISD
jgi:Integrase core domain